MAVTHKTMTVITVITILLAITARVAEAVAGELCTEAVSGGCTTAGFQNPPTKNQNYCADSNDCVVFPNKNYHACGDPDCYTFSSCSGGILTSQNCASNLHYNARFDMCTTDKKTCEHQNLRLHITGTYSEPATCGRETIDAAAGDVWFIDSAGVKWVSKEALTWNYCVGTGCTSPKTCIRKTFSWVKKKFENGGTTKKFWTPMDATCACIG